MREEWSNKKQNYTEMREEWSNKKKLYRDEVGMG
jgi:hypothetical protein